MMGRTYFSNNRSYKIVYCTPALYSAGGVERVVSFKASYFADVYDYDVTVIITEGFGKSPFFPLSDKVKVINLNLCFENLWKVSFIKKILLYIKKQHKYRLLLTRELMRIRPDFTISVLRREVNFICSIQDGSVKIGELHVNRANYRNFTPSDSNPLKRIFARFWINNLVEHLKKLDRMVVLTESAWFDWPELNNLLLIPDPLPFRVDRISTLSKKRVISIGRYDFEKGNDLLLRAWAKVQKSCEDWTLDIFGMGEQTQYRQIIKELGIDVSRCHLHGSLFNVKDEYLDSSIFVLPSRSEGFGLVVIEAMSCGLPVISFDCDNGPRNIILNGQNGYLVPPFDINEYADRIIQLIQNEELRLQMGKNAQHSSHKYDIDTIAIQWKKLFDELKQKT